jgi:large subunit ribosomal protein L10
MPSAQTLEAKKAKVAKVVDLLKNSCSGVLVDYRGISVEEDTKLRKELREAGVTYFVEKNTILRMAFKETGLDGLCDVLEGTTAIAICENDQTAPARILGKFAESHNDFFELKAGYVEGEVYDQKGVVALSKIPSKETLLAQLVGSLQGPMQKLAATLQALQEKKAAEEAA